MDELDQDFSGGYGKGGGAKGAIQRGFEF
jgi:hypothetical protein